MGIKTTLTVIAITVLGLWITYLIGIWIFFDESWGFDNRGTFGDTFGGINALFSGLALGGIVTAIFMQKSELALQREELEHTRKILQHTAQINAYIFLIPQHLTESSPQYNQVLAESYIAKMKDVLEKIEEEAT